MQKRSEGGTHDLLVEDLVRLLLAPGCKRRDVVPCPAFHSGHRASRSLRSLAHKAALYALALGTDAALRPFGGDITKLCHLAPGSWASGLIGGQELSG